MARCWPDGLSMHHNSAADLNGLGGVFGDGSYAGLSGLKKRLVGPFSWLGGVLWRVGALGEGAGAGAMTVFTVYPTSTGRAYRTALPAISVWLSLGTARALRMS